MRAFNPLPDLAELTLTGHLKATRADNEQLALAEIGCSRGDRLARLMLAAGGFGFGVDPSTKAIRAGKKLHPNVTFSIGTAEATGLPQRSVDVVFYGWSLMYVPHDSMAAVKSELSRISRRGTTLAILDFDSDRQLETPYRHSPHINVFRRDYGREFDGDGFNLASKTTLLYPQDGNRFTTVGVEPEAHKRIALYIFTRR